MKFHSLIQVSVVAAFLFAGGGTAASAQNSEREILERFQKNIDEYMALHRRLEKELPPVKPDQPEELQASQKMLASKIRAERKNQAQGTIFTPVTRTIFRRRLRAQLDGPEGAAVRKALQDDAPSPIPLRAFAEYPRGWPLSSVPPSVLAVLPKLPDDLEYRFVGRDMILRDVHANLIIDFIHDAFR